MFKRAGYKIQKIAMVFCVLGALAAIGAAAWCYTNDTLWHDLESSLRILICVGIGLGGILASWLLSLPIYAYGRMAECTEEMADTQLAIEKQLATLTDIVEHLPVLRMGSAAAANNTRNEKAAETALPRDKRYFAEAPVGQRDWPCPECGKINPPTEQKCMSCGAGGLWPCKKCGQVSSYNLDVCPACGTVDTRRCPYCGKENPRNSRTCGECGKALFAGDV